MYDELDEFIEAVLGQKRCKCCRRPLRANTVSDYCRRAVCFRERLKSDLAFREMVHSRNNRWQKQKAESDPEWAAKRREANRRRSAARRAKSDAAVITREQEVSDA